MKTNFMRTYIILLITVLSSHFIASGQSGKSASSLQDVNISNYEKSVVDGDTIYTFIPQIWELRSDLEQREVIEEQGMRSVYGVENRDLSHIPESYPVDKTIDIGDITINQGTASGALTYSVPINIYPATNGMNPTVQISYNSLSGNGIAGYGWHISGLSSISACNSTVYYDNAPAPVKRDKTGAYMLDGMRLIDLNTGNTSIIYYETEQGHIKVEGYLSGSIVKYFKAYYPDGNTAIYGYETNTSGKLSYPLTKMQDPVGNVINYSYTEQGNVYYISEINYGGYEGTYSSGHYAKITFTYETRPDISSTYSDGLEVASTQRLQWIRTYFNTQLLSSYNLTYENASSSLLKKIECANGGKSLNPLVFFYGENNQVVGFEERNVLLTSFFSNASVPDLILTKGKFDSGSMDDGLIAYPYRNNYGIIKIGLLYPFPFQYTYQYGSQYHPDQELLIYDKMGFTAIPSELLAEEGFIQLLAMDMDGDGKDELVKVNTTNVNATAETITFKVYDTNNLPYGMNDPELRYSFSADYGGVVNWSGLLSPSYKIFLPGDFLGKGKQTLLSITYCKNIKDESVQSYATMIDFDAQGKSVLYDKPCFALNWSDRLYPIDFDGDGKTDICHVSSSGTKIYTFNTSGQLYEMASYPSLTLSSLNNRELLAGDVNGDGKTDLLLSPEKNIGNVWSLYLSTSASGAFSKKDINLTGYLQDMKFILQDMNGDGKADLVINNNGTISMYLAANGILKSTPEPQTISVNADAHFIAGSIGSASKMSQLFSIYDDTLKPITFSRNEAKQQLLTGAVTSTGIVSKHEYSDLRNPYGAYHQGDACTYPYRNLMGNMYIHASTESYLADTFISSASYFYTRGVLDMRGRGLLGFEEIRVDDNFRGTTITQTFNPENFGVLESIDSPVTSALYNYNVNVAANKIAKITLANKTEQDKLKNISVTSNYVYDNYGNLTNEIANFGGGLKTITDNSYNNHTSLSYYKLGELTNQSIANYHNTEYTITGKVITYNTKGQPVSITATSNNYQVKKDSLLYDNKYSNLTEIRTKTYTSDTCLSVKYQYDDNYCGRVIRKTDPLELYEIYGYNTRGLLQSVTNHKNKAIQYEYDTWGRRKKTTYPDGAVESVNLKWIESNDQLGSLDPNKDNGNIHLSTPLTQGGTIMACNSITLSSGFSYSAASSGSLRLGIDRNACLSSPQSVGDGKYLYAATVTATGSPTKQVYIDALGREVRTGEMHFDGNFLYTDRLYDYLGRPEKVSLPFKGTDPNLWNTYRYDDYDRITSLNYASGKKDSCTYNNNTVTRIVDGITRTTTYDAAGRITGVTDPAGNVTYYLRSDGQPDSIKVPGNITTHFQYDQYGRQTEITDPSAGTKTFEYDGAGNIWKNTDANGKIIQMTYDGYNRVIQKEIVNEMITGFTYNSDGQLDSLMSDNGTGKTFIYDELGRIYTVKENVPDGKFLQKKYIYNAGSLASTEYASNNGTIATENYYYAHGNLSEIRLNNNTPVWKLTQENNLGMPSESTTGSLVRTYEYNNYGLPLARTVQNGNTGIQNFAYNLNAATGNMNWRKDVARNMQENFGYDNLNRLTGFGNNTTAYDAKGNITGHSGVGSFAYNNPAKPYAITDVSQYGTAIPQHNQDITYNGMQRPNTICENSYEASFTYNDDADRVKMQVTNNNAVELTRYYMGGQYEVESGIAGSKEKLYLGGDFYTAPAVYVKDGSGNWNIYYICRDYLGSITHITNSSGSVVQELSYDAWGRLRNPANQTVYAPGSEPVLFLGRGYTGHEHLTQFGLINMNARLYDPVLGRFLSPDPYVQDPFFSQNFNRYAYCINNPLLYTDPDGEFFLGYAFGFLRGLFSSKPWQCFEKGWQGGVNEVKIYAGLFVSDPNKNFGERVWEVTSRLTWQLPQTIAGSLFSHISNYAGQVDNVDYWGGATVLSGNNWGQTVVTLGSYIVGNRDLKADPNNYLFQHEYGHYLQSQAMGWGYLSRVGIPSLMSANGDGNHIYQPFEQDANRRAFMYFNEKVPGFYQTKEQYWDNKRKEIKKGWDFEYNPLDVYHKGQRNLGSYYDYYNPEHRDLINNLSLSAKWYDHLGGILFGIPTGIGNGIYYRNHRIM